MSFEDFFKKIDGDIASTKSNEVAGEDAKAQRKLFLNEVVARLKPVAEKYKDELIKRDVEVDVTSSPVGLLFSMKKKNTRYTHALDMSESSSFDGHFTFITHSTNDDGRKFQSTDGAMYNSSNWKDDVFTAKLEKHITDYFFYSKRHSS
ncbi:TPA: hypothetical protein MIH26_08665 [Klebsiella pneumoniae]|nr:hypothetical protein [Klebsiella pneumoniae]HBX8055924.1 hypothetical protein [Klebsiella pneumoniae]HBX8082801.1 hypothetical protein [Klebsiella pneumoniae]